MSFEEFYQRYPRKEKPRYARRCYEAALKRATHEQIMEGLERYIAAEPWHGEIQFCLHPSSFLNGDCWLNEYSDNTKRDWWDARADEQRIRERLRVVK